MITEYEVHRVLDLYKRGQSLSDAVKKINAEFAEAAPMVDITPQMESILDDREQQGYVNGWHAAERSSERIHTAKGYILDASIFAVGFAFGFVVGAIALVYSSGLVESIVSFGGAF